MDIRKGKLRISHKVGYLKVLQVHQKYNSSNLIFGLILVKILVEFEDEQNRCGRFELLNALFYVDIF